MFQPTGECRSCKPGLGGGVRGGQAGGGDGNLTTFVGDLGHQFAHGGARKALGWAAPAERLAKLLTVTG